jgi:ankyrin repeat protein
MKVRIFVSILVLIIASYQFVPAQNTTEDESKTLVYLNNELGWAADKGDVEKIDELLAAGVDVNVLVDSQHTALMDAVYYGQYEAAKLLIDKGADVNAAHPPNNTVLYHALESPELRAEIIQLLVDSGVNMGPTTLYWAAAAMITAYDKNEVPKAMSILIEAGADVNEREQKKGLTVLMVAAGAGSNQLVDILLRSGAKINATTKSGRTALAVAVAGRHTSTVKLLIEAGANLKKADKQGNTPLMIAQSKGNKEIVKLLKEAGAVK